ncbi:MAG: SRPBCC domain-containing protein [Bacteroidota bacterium]
MTTTDFSSTFLVDKSPKEVFPILLNVRSWWSGLYGETFEGSSEKLDDEFSFLAGGGMHYSKQKLIELIPDTKIVWLVTDSKLTFLSDEAEWTHTKICFEISQQGNKTQVRFTHIGLNPNIQCYDQCSNGWSGYLQQKLLPLIS